jgi:hypothetical protein
MPMRSDAPDGSRVEIAETAPTMRRRPAMLKKRVVRFRRAATNDIG